MLSVACALSTAVPVLVENSVRILNYPISGQDSHLAGTHFHSLRHLMGLTPHTGHTVTRIASKYDSAHIISSHSFPSSFLSRVATSFHSPFLFSEPEFRSPRVKFLYDKWRHVWMLSWERQRELYDHLAYLKEKQKADNFSWDDWRKRFLKFMNYKKSRLTDLFRKMDKDNNELIPRDDFIEGIIKTSESCFLILTARNSVLGVAVCALFHISFFFRI
jgi:hypothetical protein